LTHGHPSSPGVPEGCTKDTLVLEYNDCQQVADVFAKRGGEIAAVILEPVVGNMGLVEPSSEFLALLRAECDRSGAVLIFDEVMTGFRLAYGGAQELLGVRPDMTTLGKIIGGGMPVGAYGGRKEILSKVSPLGPVYQAGTLSGNPVAMASGIATLKTLRDTKPYAKLADYTTKLCAGLSDLAAQAGIPHVCPHVGSMWTFFFNPKPVVNLSTAMGSDTARFARFFRLMLDRGVYLACSQFEANFVSVTHGDDHLQATLSAARDSFARLATE
jgi:glutamate-1-semialdehyde 2,1-aminomutase